jgi:UDP-glucose 4-epimerase
MRPTISWTQTQMRAMERLLNRPIGVVGSKGFIGNSLAHTLERFGYKVSSFDSSNPPLTPIGGLHQNLLGLEVLIWCATKVNPIFADRFPDLVDSEIKEWKTFVGLWQGNSVTSSIPIIFISSGGCVYTGNETPFTESSPSSGINAYGIMKSQMERELDQSGIPFKILRVANVYGPGQPIGRGQGVIAEWINAINNGHKIEVFGSLQSFRDFIHVDDVVSAIVNCLGFPHLNGVFNIGSGKATTLQEVLNALINISSKELLIHNHAARRIDRQGYFLDASKGLEILRWKSEIGLQEGLRSCLDYGRASYGK